VGPLVVPVEQLSRDALLGLVDAFVLREGTDYGHDEPTLEDKRREVLSQIERGEVLLVFDPRTEEANLLPRRDVPPGLLR